MVATVIPSAGLYLYHPIAMTTSDIEGHIKKFSG
jgi:hypothetical protein